MPSIATGSVELRADAKKLDEGLKNAKGEIVGFYNATTKQFEKIKDIPFVMPIPTGFQKAEAKLTEFGEKIEKKFKRIAESPFTKLFAGIVNGIKAVGDVIGNTVERAVNLDRFAQAVGASVEDFSRLSFAAKVSGIEDVSELADGIKELVLKMGDYKAEEIEIPVSLDTNKLKNPDLPAIEPIAIPAMVDLVKIPSVNVPDIKIGAVIDDVKVPTVKIPEIKIPVDADTSKLDKSLTVLGRVNVSNPFAKLELSIRELEKLPLPEQLGKIADKLNKIKNPVDKLNIAVGIFGDEAALKMLPLLSKGSQGIAELTKQADKLGITMNRVQVDKLKEINASYAKIRATVQALLDKAIVALAPAIARFGDVALDIFTKLLPMINAAIKAMSLLADAADFALRKVDQASGFIDKKLAQNKLPPVFQMMDFALSGDFEKAIEKAKKEAFEKLQMQSFKRIVIPYELALKPNKTFPELPELAQNIKLKPLRLFGILNMMNTDIENELKTNPPVIEVPIQPVLLEGLDSFLESLKTPFDKFMDQLRRLNEWEARQQITGEQYFLGVDQAAKQFLGTMKEIDSLKPAPAIFKGSREELQLEIDRKIQSQQPKRDTNTIRDYLEEQKRANKESNENGRKIIQLLGQLKPQELQELRK